MHQSQFYEDKLIQITADAIILKNFYFPFLTPKEARFSSIESIEAAKPGLWNGKFRLWGTDSFTIWLPLDIKRPIRDKIFIIKYKEKKVRSGFTAEDSARVESILRTKGLIK